MNVELSKKLAQKLGKEYICEFAIAVEAIEWVQARIPEQKVCVKENLLYGYSREITAGEYLTMRNLWDLV